MLFLDIGIDLQRPDIQDALPLHRPVCNALIGESYHADDDQYNANDLWDFHLPIYRADLPG